jgi:hypothetical protein
MGLDGMSEGMARNISAIGKKGKEKAMEE